MLENGNAAGIDGGPGEMSKEGCVGVAVHLYNVCEDFICAWWLEDCHHVPLYKRKYNKKECKNYTAIKLSHMPVKVWAEFWSQNVALSRIWEMHMVLCQPKT